MKIKSKGNAVSASITYCISSVLSKLITLAATPIFTRLMSEVEYGKYILYISLYGILASAATVPTSSGVLYNLFADKRSKYGELSFAGFLVSAPINLIICLLLFAFSGVLGIDGIVLPILFFHTLLDTLVSAHLAIHRYEFRAGVVFAIEISKSALGFLLSLLFTSRLSLGYIGRALAFVITLIPFSLISFVALRAAIKRVSFDDIISVFRNSLSLIVSALSLSVGVYSVNILISARLGEAALASYSIFNALSTSPVFVIGALISAIAPFIQRRLTVRDFASISRAHELAASLMSCIAMFIFLISREALLFLAPKSYGENIYILLPLIFYVLIKFSDQFLGAMLSAKRIYRPTLISNILFSLFTILSISLSLDTLGLFAPGIALGFGITVSALYKLNSVRHALPDVITLKSTLLHPIFSLLFGALALSLGSHPEIRILLAIFPTVKALNLYFENRGSVARRGVG